MQINFDAKVEDGEGRYVEVLRQVHLLHEARGQAVQAGLRNYRQNSTPGLFEDFLYSGAPRREALSHASRQITQAELESILANPEAIQDLEREADEMACRNGREGISRNLQEMFSHVWIELRAGRSAAEAVRRTPLDHRARWPRPRGPGGR